VARAGDRRGLAGLAVSLLKFPLWQPLWLGVKMLGDVSIPLLLFSLGVRLTDAAMGDWKLSIVGAHHLAAGRHLVALLMNPVLGLSPGATPRCCSCSVPCRRRC
jgi:predicted permease